MYNSQFYSVHINFIVELKLQTPFHIDEISSNKLQY